MISTLPFDLAGKRVYVAGHQGMVGSALLRRLEREDCEIVTAERKLDLRDQAATRLWFEKHAPQVVFVAAAKVGGIAANSRQPAEFGYDNLMIAANVIEAARQAGVEKLLYLGSSCIYPKHADQPIAEESLLTGHLEPTNEAYAVAKIAGLKLCQFYRRQYGCDFISAMPTNLYGPGDKFSLEDGHVLPALLAKAERAQRSGAATLPVWGSGKALREFLHVDDLADACVFLMRNYSSDMPINVGSGEEISIADLARLIIGIVGVQADLAFDPSRPDGTPRKLLDSSRIHALGWRASIGLREGIRQTYEASRDRLV